MKNRWLRAMLYGVAAEILLIPVTAVLALFVSATIMQYGTIPLSFASMFLFAWLVVRKGVARPLLHGAVVGLAAFAFYFALGAAIDVLLMMSGTEVPAEFAQAPPQECTRPPTR